MRWTSNADLVFHSVMIFCLLFTVLSQVFAQEYVIDKVDKIIDRECFNCPGFVSESFIVTPVKDNVGYPKENLKFFGCQATLIAPQRVILAAHCLRASQSPEWQELSQGDCGKMAGFYFPKTSQYPSQKARCKKIVSPLYMSSGVKQLEPDHLIVELDQEIQRQSTQWTREPILKNTPYFIWGYDANEKTFSKRTCYALPAPSVLTPLSYDGRGTYLTLTCDGDLEQGWSGAGVLNSLGQVVGVVSFGFDRAGFGAGTFGMNEVSISLSRCFSEEQSDASCFVDEKTKMDYLIHVYALAIDQALIWQTQTIRSLEKTFKGHRFEYTQYKETPLSLLSFPAFKTKCIDGNLKNEKKDVVLYAVSDLTNLNPNYFLFNQDSTAKGVVETPIDGLTGTFSIPFNFIKGPIGDLPICQEGVKTP